MFHHLENLDHPPAPRQAIGELLVAAMFWGFGFVAISWSLGALSPLWIVSGRFLVAFLVGLPLVVIVPGFRKAASRSQFFMAMYPGLFLGLTLVLQTWGLKYTTATNSGFITCLYVLLVPLFGALLFKRFLSSAHWSFVALALFGTALICKLHDATHWNRGDLLTLFCSFTAATQILWLGQVAPHIKSSFVFNVFQCFWSSVLALALALTTEPRGILAFSTSPSSVFTILFLALGCTLFGFLAQIRAQKVLSSSMASMLFLLESPFSAFFAFFFLQERLEGTQWLGAAFILAATAGAVRLEARSITPRDERLNEVAPTPIARRPQPSHLKALSP